MTGWCPRRVGPHTRSRGPWNGCGAARTAGSGLFLAYERYGVRSRAPDLGPTRIISVTDRQSDGGGAVSLAVAPEYTPRKRADVLELDMGDGVVLYDPGSKLVHHLNPSASLLWQLAEGDASLGQLADEISTELRLDRSEVHEQFVSLVAELDALGLLSDTNDTAVPPDSPDREREDRHA